MKWIYKIALRESKTHARVSTIFTCRNWQSRARVVEWQTRQVEGLVAALGRASSTLAPSTIANKLFF